MTLVGSAVPDSLRAAEAAWLQRWTTGPTEAEGTGLPAGSPAPDLALRDHTGALRNLAEFWSGQPALVLFWRHFGCGCGVERARQLAEQWELLRAAGLNPVVVGQGDPQRASAYRAQHSLPCPLLCDPSLTAYRAFGLGQWSVERVLHEAPEQFWQHEPDLGVSFQAERRREGRPLVDDPWRQSMECVVGIDGRLRLTYLYQYCEDYPPASVLTTAARLS